MKTDETSSAVAEEQILRSVRRHQSWLRGLTTLALTFWLLTVVGGVGVLVGYAVFYAPKEKQMFADYQRHGQLTRHAPSASGSEPVGPLDLQQALGVHFTMNYAVTKGILAVVITVIVLSCGTLTTLLLVVLNRRVTLKQINFSLAQISDQLRALQSSAGGTPQS